MPGDFNVTIAASKDLRSIDVVDQFRDDNKNFKDGLISMNGKAYRVSFFKEGDQSFFKVEREYRGLFAGYRNKHSSKNTVHARELAQRLKTILGSKEYALVRSNYDKLMSIAKSSGNKTRVEVADYGFRDNRDIVKNQGVVEAVNRKLQQQGSDKSIWLNKIDTYNTLSRITVESLNMRNYGKTMELLHNKGLKFDKNLYEQLRHTVGDAQLKAYFKFICDPKNVEKIDIPRKIWSYMHQNGEPDPSEKQTGWKADFRRNPDQALRNFVIKNLSRGAYKSDEFVAKVTERFKEFLEISNTKDPAERKSRMDEFLKPENWLTEKQINDYKQKVMNYADDHDLSYDQALERYGRKHDILYESALYVGMQNVLTVSTFRQTSKLGLDFFHKQKVPVLFQYADYSQKDLKGEGMQHIKNENHWKQGRIDENTVGSPITHSELRRAQRMQQELGDDFNVRLAHGG
jgi:hypothetical protein